MTLRVEKCALPEVLLISPRVFGDDRGFFLETYSERDFAAAGITARFVQDNHSRSKKGVLRGLHYQLENPQGKLVRVARGKIFDVAAESVDLATRIEAADALGQVGDQRLEQDNWVKIPASTFMMGAQKKDKNGRNYDPEADTDEHVHEVTLRGFRIGRP